MKLQQGLKNDIFRVIALYKRFVLPKHTPQLDLA